MQKNFFPYTLLLLNLDISGGEVRSQSQCPPTTRFFQAKLIHPALWNAWDYVLQFNFIIGHVAVSMNTAADFLFRTEVNPVEKPEKSIRSDIQMKAIDVNVQSSRRRTNLNLP